MISFKKHLVTDFVKSTSVSAHDTTTHISLAKFDLDSILKASQVISSTFDMNNLLLNIMKIVSMEICGTNDE